jgi:CRISPR-associated exonuclease Cas4
MNNMLGGRDIRKIIVAYMNERHKKLRRVIDDPTRIYTAEASQCTRLSYYERVDPINSNSAELLQILLTHGFRHSFENMESEYKTDNLTLVLTADFILEKELVVRLKITDSLPGSPRPQDLLYLNACLYAFDKPEGILIYVRGDGKSSEFLVAKSAKMFEELIRRARVLSTLLKEKRVPIVEPSESCMTCKYYGRCYMMERKETSFSIDSLFGKSKDETS